MKYYIKATLAKGVSGYDPNFIYLEGYNRHPNPIRNNNVCGKGRIHIAKDIKTADSYIENAHEYYLAQPFEILAEDEDKVAVVDCWLWRIPNEIIKKYERTRQAAREEYERIEQPARAEYERTRQPAWKEYERIEQPAWKEYNRIIQPARAEYKRIVQPAWKEYDNILKQAYDNIVNKMKPIIDANPAYKKSS